MSDDQPSHSEGPPLSANYYQPATRMEAGSVAEANEIATRASARPESAAEVTSQEQADSQVHNQKLRDGDQDIELKNTVAHWALGAASLVVVSSIVAFFVYLNAVRGEVASEIMIAWLSATVVEVLGIVAIIATYLFPGRDRNT